MNKNVMKLKMLISSYFPLYIILLIVNSDIFLGKYKFISIVKFFNKKESIFILALVILSIISLWTVFDLIITKGNEYYVFEDIQKNGDTIISYFMMYIVPLLSFDIKNNDSIIINVGLYLIISFMYIRLDLLYLNPLWLLSGYEIFKTSDNQIIISNFRYSKIKNRQGIRLKGINITEGIYLIQKSDNKENII